jgi:hypothetical protein
MKRIGSWNVGIAYRGGLSSSGGTGGRNRKARGSEEYSEFYVVELHVYERRVW